MLLVFFKTLNSIFIYRIIYHRINIKKTFCYSDDRNTMRREPPKRVNLFFSKEYPFRLETIISIHFMHVGFFQHAVILRLAFWWKQGFRNALTV